MNIKSIVLCALGGASAFAHTLDTTDREALRAHILEEWSVKQTFLSARTSLDPAKPGDAYADRNVRITLRPQIASTAASLPPNTPEAAKPFLPFTKLDLRADADFLYIGSNGMPDHHMMIGITAWQQQVPIPQIYFGDNAWRIPLKPVPAQNPMSAKTNFFKGAIALAANGVPIFNPIKTNGHTDTFLAGELDQWGGHCGRADDYHYHIAPLHLQAKIGKSLPVAYALDGYAIYGLDEPDGSAVTGLDEFNGHESATLGYHYHATKTYPYINGGFHGEVVERNGQVDPQPRTSGVRPFLPPLPGAKITGFINEADKKYSVTYEVGSETRHVNYRLNDDSTVKFEFVDGKGQVTTATHSPRDRVGGGGGGDRLPGGGDKGERGKGKGDRGKGGQRPDTMKREEERRPDAKASASATAPLLITPKHSGNMVLTSPALNEGDPLPDEFNGNGEGATLPLEWKGAPQGTQSYALVMDHIDRDGILKTYWTLYDIPASVTSLPKNVQGIGKLGGTWKRDATYVSPHSAGGAKQTYTLHLYALPAAPQFEGEGLVTREQLLTKIKDTILDSAEFNVTYQRPRDDERGGGGDRKEKKPRPQSTSKP